MSKPEIYNMVLEIPINGDIKRVLVVTENPDRIERQIKEVIEEGNTTNTFAQIMRILKGGPKK